LPDESNDTQPIPAQAPMEDIAATTDDDPNGSNTVSRSSSYAMENASGLEREGDARIGSSAPAELNPASMRVRICLNEPKPGSSAAFRIVMPGHSDDSQPLGTSESSDQHDSRTRARQQSSQALAQGMQHETRKEPLKAKSGSESESLVSIEEFTTSGGRKSQQAPANPFHTMPADNADRGSEVGEESPQKISMPQNAGAKDGSIVVPPSLPASGASVSVPSLPDATPVADDVSSESESENVVDFKHHASGTPRTRMKRDSTSDAPNLRSMSDDSSPEVSSVVQRHHSRPSMSRRRHSRRRPSSARSVQSPFDEVDYVSSNDDNDHDSDIDMTHRQNRSRMHRQRERE